ncbi:MAG: helix-turn-helix domain-containing protein [Paludibacteraceae bacterium]|jgi:transcriptional regulator with XRE-family HTH domain|nr:helix-turn-helix domain-containing protein [Paludibacteraceae bacterium]
MDDINGYSIPEWIHLLGERFKDYRMRANMTQKDVAEKSGLTVQTISKFESGMTNNMSLVSFLLLIKSIGLVGRMDELLPELPESPYLYRTDEKKAQRIRHKKQ